MTIHEIENKLSNAFNCEAFFDGSPHYTDNKLNGWFGLWECSLCEPNGGSCLLDVVITARSLTQEGLANSWKIEEVHLCDENAAVLMVKTLNC